MNYQNETGGVAGAYQNLGLAQATTIKQPTIAGAVGRIDSLNGRLSQIVATLNGISDSIGGPRPCDPDKSGEVQQSGVVFHLNDSANAAHRKADEIESLLASIARQLG